MDMEQIKEKVDLIRGRLYRIKSILTCVAVTAYHESCHSDDVTFAVEHAAAEIDDMAMELDGLTWPETMIDFQRDFRALDEKGQQSVIGYIKNHKNDQGAERGRV